MEKPEIGPRHPKTPEPMITKICMGDYVPDTYCDAKFHYDPTRYP